jgi:hypothetical protein
MNLSSKRNRVTLLVSVLLLSAFTLCEIKNDQGQTESVKESQLVPGEAIQKQARTNKVETISTLTEGSGSHKKTIRVETTEKRDKKERQLKQVPSKGQKTRVVKQKKKSRERRLRYGYQRHRRPSPAYYKKKQAKDKRINGCILTAEFRHFFYNLLTRSAEFTIQFFSNCANIPEITFRIFYENHMYISWYNHPTEVYLNLFNNVYKLKFSKPKTINQYDITKAMMYQKLSVWGLKKNPPLLDLNFDNQTILSKQHLYGFEPRNIQRLARHYKPVPCFLRREMVKGWKKIIKRRILAKKRKKKQMEAMLKTMSQSSQGRRLRLIQEVPEMKQLINRKLFETYDNINNRPTHLRSVKHNIKMVKKRGGSVGRELELINSDTPAERSLKDKSKKKSKKSKKKSKKKKKKKKKLTAWEKKKLAEKKKREAAKKKREKFKKMVKKVSAMKYKMNKELILKKMRKKLIKGYYLVCASP